MKFKNLNYCLILLPFLLQGCAIKYKSTLPISGITANKASPDSIKGRITIMKAVDSVILFRNTRIKRQLINKGYRSYILSVENNSRDTIQLTSKNLYAIKDYQPIDYVAPEEVSRIIRWNRGFFLATAGYGLASPFAYAGGRMVFSKTHLLIAIPLVVYGTVNSVIAYRSAKNLSDDIHVNYLLEKRVPPGTTLRGMILIKSEEDSVEFVYRSAN